MRGVYFIANDRIIDLAIAFLNSFRKYNPSIPLCLIPYNSAYSELGNLQEKYNFTIFTNKEALLECDEASSRFHDHVVGQYRKIAMWEGEFSEFVYIDVDTVVLGNIEFAFEYLNDYAIVVSQSNDPGLREWVWKDTIYQTGKLSLEQIEFSANTGFICSKQGKIPRAALRDKLNAAVELAPHMELSCTEQPLLNYLIVTSGLRITSLGVLRQKYRETPTEVWAGSKAITIIKGRAFQRWPEAPIFLMHWAGKWQPNDRDRKRSALLNKFGLDRIPSPISHYMPYKSLWKYYRYLA